MFSALRHRIRLAVRALLGTGIDRATGLPVKVRHYGDDGTIHGTGEVNVEVDRNGRVVSVWFRCSMLPFTQTIVREDRAASMRRAYTGSIPRITAIDFVD